MRFLRNERGGALVVTLIALVIGLVFISIITSQAVQTTKHSHVVHDANDARLIAEAGVDFYQAYIEKEAAVNLEKIPEMQELDDNHRFEITDVAVITDGEKETVSFTSIGWAFDIKSEIKQTFVVYGAE